MPSRRSYLATLAAAGIAGCIGDSPATGTDSESPTATTAPGTAPQPDTAIEAAAAVQYAYRHIEQVDWNGIHSADGQFVFVTVDASEADTAPARSAFSLVVNGEQYDSIELAHPYVVDLDVPGNAYEPDGDDPETRGWLAFETPAQLDAEPVLRLDRDPAPATWELSVPKATAAPPAWDWHASTPETVEPESTFGITITAENVGDGPGIFRGAVNFSYPMYMPKAFDVALDPSESGTATVEAEIEDAEAGKEIEYGVRTPAGESTVTVTVEGESTPTAAPE